VQARELKNPEPILRSSVFFCGPFFCVFLRLANPVHRPSAAYVGHLRRASPANAAIRDGNEHFDTMRGAPAEGTARGHAEMRASNAPGTLSATAREAYFTPVLNT
jgi:hypothetical protein